MRSAKMSVMARIDLTVLRDELTQPISRLSSCTHKELDAEFSKLGLIEPPGDGRTKAERVAAVLAAIPDDDLERVAAKIINRDMADAAEQNNIQDALWAGNDVPQILKRTRREIAADLDLEDLVVEPSRFTHMLNQLWVLGGENPLIGIFGAVPAFGSQPSLRERIERHVYQNPGDWPAEKLFEELGTFEASDRRFALFLERLVSHQVVPYEATQRKILEVINPHLRKNRLELRESGTDGGYPVFRLVPTGLAPMRRPKNLIFASSTKPDLRLSDALDKTSKFSAASPTSSSSTSRSATTTTTTTVFAGEICNPGGAEHIRTRPTSKPRTHCTNVFTVPSLKAPHPNNSCSRSTTTSSVTRYPNCLRY